MLYCGSCRKEKPESEFYPRKGSKSGYQGKCKLCERIYALHNPEVQERARKKHREANLEDIKKYQKEYQTVNRERIKQRRKKNAI